MAHIGVHAALSGILYSAWLVARLLLMVTGVFGLIVLLAGMVAARSEEICPDPNRVPPFPNE
jgi:hypothetical protein